MSSLASVLLNLYALLIAPVNLLAGTNFLYPRAKPATATPFDWFGPWPFYIAVLELLAVALFWTLERALAGVRARRER